MVCIFTTVVDGIIMYPVAHCSTSWRRNAYTLMSKDATYAKMYRDLRKGRRVVVCQRVQGGIENLKTLVDKKLVAGHQSTAESRDELYDVPTHGQKHQFIGYTSTTTVSLDFAGAVHRVYVFPNPLASIPREMYRGSTGQGIS